MSESEPISFRPRQAGVSTRATGHAPPREAPGITAFNRQELNQILAVYGRKVAGGEWRDYALDMGREKAVFSVFRRASEFPIFRIEKNPKLARRQGAYAVVAPGGFIVKRGHDLARVLTALEDRSALRLLE